MPVHSESLQVGPQGTSEGGSYGPSKVEGGQRYKRSGVLKSDVIVYLASSNRDNVRM